MDIKEGEILCHRTTNSPLCLAGVLVEPILAMRPRKCGEEMPPPFRPPPPPPATVLLALNVELGVVHERAGDPLRGGEDMTSDAIVRGRDFDLSRPLSDKDKNCHFRDTTGRPFFHLPQYPHN